MMMMSATVPIPMYMTRSPGSVRFVPAFFPAPAARNASGARELEERPSCDVRSTGDPAVGDDCKNSSRQARCDATTGEMGTPARSRPALAPREVGQTPQRLTATWFGSSPRSIASATSASAISGVGAGVVWRARTASQ